MHVIAIPSAGPKMKLIEAAERLFADRGFEAVSVRDITSLAGANVAAVNYHFGSRDGLVAAVMTRYVMPVNEERIARLESAERRWAGKAVPLEEIVDAFSRPLVSRVLKSELSEKLFHKLLGRIFGEQSEMLPPELEAQFQAVATVFMRALARALPWLTPEEITWRIHFLAGSMIHLLTHGEMVQRFSRGVAGNPSLETSFGRFTRFVCAGLREGETTQTAAAEVVEEEEEDSPQAFFNF